MQNKTLNFFSLQNRTLDLTSTDTEPSKFFSWDHAWPWLLATHFSQCSAADPTAGTHRWACPRSAVISPPLSIPANGTQGLQINTRTATREVRTYLRGPESRVHQLQRVAGSFLSDSASKTIVKIFNISAESHLNQCNSEVISAKQLRVWLHAQHFLLTSWDTEAYIQASDMAQEKWLCQCSVPFLLI